jgi:signal peptidase I
MRLAFWKKPTSDSKEIKKKKPVWREWLDALVFAIVAATIIRIFLVEAYTIPSSSMEGSLLVNDYLFVSKLAYGPRIPNTPLAVPLVHNTMPFFGGKSYTDAVQWKYHRWLGMGKVERNDVVVFNFPNGDTVLVEDPQRDYYQVLRGEFDNNRELLKTRYTIITHPIDKKDNYIKRCVGVPGDKIEVREGLLYVNDKPANSYAHSKLSYRVETKGGGFADEFLEDNNIESKESNGVTYMLLLSPEEVALIKKQPQVVSVTLDLYPKGANDWAFPQDPANFKWNRDYYGPLTIPKAGTSVTLTPQNIAMYRRLIAIYEGNKLEEKNGKFTINGKETTTYTFKMDYYWMMGDNRHNSADSRYFGFVPEDHIVGKASFVWFSHNKNSLFNIRWRRIFHSIHSLEQ